MPPDSSVTVRRSFVLRLWIEPQPCAAPIWHCILIDPHSGDRIGFGSPSELVAYLTAMPPFNLGDGEAETPPPKP